MILGEALARILVKIEACFPDFPTSISFAITELINLPRSVAFTLPPSRTVFSSEPWQYDTSPTAYPGEPPERVAVLRIDSPLYIMPFIRGPLFLYAIKANKHSL